MYFCILFCSPLYFLIRQRWLGFFVNAIFYGLACLCILTFVGIWIAPIFWMLGVGHATFTYRKEAMTKHAELIATKMAEKMQEKK